MKKSILNLGQAIKKAEQKEITGGYGGGSGGPGTFDCCYYKLCAGCGSQVTDCYTAERMVWMYGSPTASWGTYSGICP